MKVTARVVPFVNMADLKHKYYTIKMVTDGVEQSGNLDIYDRSRKKLEKIAEQLKYNVEITVKP